MAEQILSLLLYLIVILTAFWFISPQKTPRSHPAYHLACLLEDAPESSLKGQFCPLATPLATPIACTVPQVWRSVYRTLLSTTSLSSNSTTVSSISTSYKNLFVVLKNVHCAANDTVRMRQNGDTSTSNYINSVFKCSNTTLSGVAVRSNYFNIGEAPGQPYTDLQRMNAQIFIQRYTDTNVVASYIQSQGYSGDGATTVIYQGSGIYDNSAAITSITFLTAGANNFDSGTIYIYGVD